MFGDTLVGFPAELCDSHVVYIALGRLLHTLEHGHKNHSETD